MKIAHRTYDYDKPPAVFTRTDTTKSGAVRFGYN